MNKPYDATSGRIAVVSFSSFIHNLSISVRSTGFVPILVVSAFITNLSNSIKTLSAFTTLILSSIWVANLVLHHPIGWHSRFSQHTCTSTAFEPVDPTFLYQLIGRYAHYWRPIDSLADLVRSNCFFHCQTICQIGWHVSHRPGSHVYPHAGVKSDFCVNSITHISWHTPLESKFSFTILVFHMLVGACRCSSLPSPWFSCCLPSFYLFSESKRYLCWVLTW
jgi:hypothetical protein